MKDWGLRARVNIQSNLILTVAAFWFASAPMVSVRVRRLGRSGRSEQPRGEVRRVVASVAEGPSDVCSTTCETKLDEAVTPGVEKQWHRSRIGGGKVLEADGG